MPITREEFIRAWRLDQKTPLAALQFLMALECYCYDVTSRYDEHLSVCPENPENERLVSELVRDLEADPLTWTEILGGRRRDH